MVATNLVISVFLIACASIGKAAIVVAAGALLTRRGAFTPTVRKGLSNAAASLLVPCLLLDRLGRTVTLELVAAAWPIIPIGILYVSIGCGLGAIATVGQPSHIRRPSIAAAAFANSNAMPIILIEVIGPELFGPGAAATGVTYIGLYLTVYLVLQWTIGASLLDVPLLSLGGGEQSSKKLAQSDAALYDSSGDGSGGGGSGGSSSSSSSSSSSAVTRTSVDGGDGISMEQPSPRDDRQASAQATAGTAGLLVAGVDTGSSAEHSCWRGLVGVLGRVASPPVYGIMAGLCVGLIPPLRWLLVSGPVAAGDAVTAMGSSASSSAAPSASSPHHPPLGFMMQAAGLLGDAAVPLNTMLLGASLAKGPTWRSAPSRVVVGVVLSKLLFLPVAALAFCAVLQRLVVLPPLLLLVVLMESAMPTANNLMMMCELGGGKSNQLMSTLIFGQYVASPVLMTITLTAFMAFVQTAAV